MLTGINQWAFPKDMTAEDALKLAARLGYQSFELCVGEDGPVPLGISEAEATALRRVADRFNIVLSTVGTGLGWQYPLTSPSPEVREKGIEVTERALQIAQWLGTHTVLTVPGIVSPEVPYDVALENALACVQKMVPVAENLRVGIGVENVWNKFLLSPVEMRDFIDQCESDYVGAYVDTGNIILYGYPEHYLRILGRRVRAVHAKDFRASAGNFDGFVMLMEGDVNWPAVRTALDEIGFDGALTAEYGPYTHSLEVMLRHVHASLEAIIALAP
ncbi:MAG: D-tagatose 3-epimerase [Candidatus Hydrogenedentes bacterium ADurb.Bin101]|jgi:hexulose-6-phosphate isomerase|nr:MAG: D-tagatose 3-epimerase [Candidatus Hydrogenedentes bacterium ADurb.Bin101]HOC68815.1 sugar phosphate isomerase/epimerase family protein [Candidatus Hydrogenedentota bacterium]